MARVKECHTELKLALGDKYQTAYKGRKKNMVDARRYVRDLKARSKEIRRLTRQQAADDKAVDRLHAEEMEKHLQHAERDRLKAAEADKIRCQQVVEEKARDRKQAAEEKELDREYAAQLEEQRLQQVSDEKFREKEIEAKKLEASAGLAKDALLLCLSEASSCPDLSVSELERIKADAKLCCHKFRMAHLDLATILGDRYENEHRENEKSISESAQIKISELSKLIREKQETRGNSERVLGEQYSKYQEA